MHWLWWKSGPIYSVAGVAHAQCLGQMIQTKVDLRSLALTKHNSRRGSYHFIPLFSRAKFSVQRLKRIHKPLGDLAPAQLLAANPYPLVDLSPSAF